MFKREFKINLKALIIWSACLFITFLFVFLIYPTLFTEENVAAMNSVMNSMPPELLAAFNMDLNEITKASGWVNSEGIIFLLLSTSIYASILGLKAVYSEKQNGTIEYLGVRGVSREKIVLKKVLADLLCIAIFTTVNVLTIVIGLSISENISIGKYLAVTIAPIFTGLFMYFAFLFISIIYKGSTLMGIGVSILFYIITTISQISDKVSFLKYFSAFTFADIRYILTNGHLNIISVVLSIVLSGALFAGSLYFYRKKELVK